MKIVIPNITEHGVPHFSRPSYTREANEDFFNTIEDAKQYIFDEFCDEKYESYNKQKDTYTEKSYTVCQMVTQINNAIDMIEQNIFNNKILPCLIKDFKNQTNYKPLLKNMNEYIRAQYETELEQLKLIHKANLHQRNNFLKENINKIIEYLIGIKHGYLNKIKNKQVDKNKKYMANKNKILGITPRQVLTEEQKKENIKQSKIRYNEKQKLLKLNSKDDLQVPIILPTEAQNILPIEVPIILPNELTTVQIKRREYNRRYYDKKMNTFNPVSQA